MTDHDVNGLSVKSSGNIEYVACEILVTCFGILQYDRNGFTPQRDEIFGLIQEANINAPFIGRVVVHNLVFS